MLFEDGTQGFSLDIFDHQVLFRMFLIEIEEMLHVRMIDAIADLGFTFIALKHSDVPNQFRAWELEHNFLLVVDIASKIDTVHTTMSQHPNNFVVIDLRTW